MAHIQRSAAAFAASALLLTCSLGAIAQAPGQIYACVHKSSEQVRFVAANVACTQNETRVTFNTGGAKGDKGDTGATGAKGDKGDAGATGSKGDKGDPGAGLETGIVTGQAISCNGGLAGAMAYLAGQSFVAVTGSDGAFRISYVPPGTYNLVIESTGGASTTRSGVVVAAGATTAVGGLSINDLSSDPTNCGTCGNACQGGQVCSGGQCTLNCVGGTTKCGNACVNLGSDNANCGVCGNACAPGNACSGGQCVLTCAAGLTHCGNTCVNLATDTLHCGSCTSVCPAGNSCSNGQCVLVCPVGLTRCGNTCVNLASDANNCGLCGHVCVLGPTHGICSAGACQ